MMMLKSMILIFPSCLISSERAFSVRVVGVVVDEEDDPPPPPPPPPPEEAIVIVTESLSDEETFPAESLAQAYRVLVPEEENV